jgi:TolB-like protein
MDGRPGTARDFARRAIVFATAWVWLPALMCSPAAARGQDATVTPHATFALPAAVTALDFSADGRRLLAGDAAGHVVVWDLERQVSLLSERPGGSVVFVSFLAGDTALVSVDESGAAWIRRTAPDDSGTLLEAAGRPQRVALDAGRRYLAVATTRSFIELFDLPTRQRIGVIDARREVDELLYLGFDRHGRQLVAVSQRGRVAAWNPATLEPLRRATLQSTELQGSRSRVHAVGADRGANILVTALEEVALPRGALRGQVRPGDLVRRDHLLVFDWQSGAEIKRVSFPDGVVEELAVGPGNDHVVIARGNAVTLVDLRRGERGAAITAAAPVSRLAVSTDHDWLGIGSTEGQVAVWALAYRAPPTADQLERARPGLASRLRVLGDAGPAVAPETPLTMAVLPFDERDGSGQLGRTAAELLTTQLANVEHLRLVERLRIDALLQEFDLQRQGLTEANGLELGRLLNADYVLLGSIGASGTSYTFSARLLHVETGEVVSGRQVLCEECRAQELFEVIHLLGTTIAR